MNSKFTTPTNVAYTGIHAVTSVWANLAQVQSLIMIHKDPDLIIQNQCTINWLQSQ